MFYPHSTLLTYQLTVFGQISESKCLFPHISSKPGMYNVFYSASNDNYIDNDNAHTQALTHTHTRAHAHVHAHAQAPTYTHVSSHVLLSYYLPSIY